MFLWDGHQILLSPRATEGWSWHVVARCLSSRIRSVYV
jgi:hypothetical protein